MSTQKEELQKDSGSATAAKQADPLDELVARPKVQSCKSLTAEAGKLIERTCAQKNFTIESANPCGGGGGANDPVDLVVVIDTSGSMSDEAAGLSAAADAAISAAAQSCPSDLRVAWFGIEGTWPGTRFNQTHRDYLNALGVPDADIEVTPGIAGQEDGAGAIMDISEHYDWRPGAARAIFYLGDEALEGGDPQNADDVAAANNAIAAAQAQNVTVFTYAGTGVGAVTQLEYARVAAETGGQAFAAPIANLGGFQPVLEQIICASAGQACRPVEIPEIEPCFKLRWGDGPRDRLETDDVEVLCITACNPYSNVTLKGLTIIVSGIAGPGGAPVADLPDGSPSVFIKPSHVVCFGDIPPCDPDNQDKPSCVTREVVLVSRGAAEGPYTYKFGYCFTAEFALLGRDEFKLPLVES